ncbi:MAG: glycosyltransferase family 39 protein [Bryobacteraceae bacterium]
MTRLELTNRLATAAALFFIVYFLLAGLALLPYPGIQNDEALFSLGIYDPGIALTFRSFFKHRVPMMLMSYLGALKTWIYTPIFALWKPSLWSVRLPVLLLGAVTIWLFFILLRKISGIRAALAGTALLATDASYLLTSVFDWGPVVLQHLLAVGGVLSFVRFHQSGSRRALGLGCFLFGLAMWDKALFIWTFAGMGVAVLLLYPRVIFKQLNRKNIVLALICFSIGALPFLHYNYKKEADTFRKNVVLSKAQFSNKKQILINTLDGNGLFGYMVYDDPADQPRQPQTKLERISLEIGEFAGHPRSGPLRYMAIVALFLIPLMWFTPSRKPALFAAITAGIAWLLMAFTQGAGETVHHAVLIWPWPHMLIAMAFAEASRHLRQGGTLLLGGIIAYTCAGNALVANEHLVKFARNGAMHSWSDANTALHAALEQSTAKQVFAADWGIIDGQRLMSDGRLCLRWVGAGLRSAEISEVDRQGLQELVTGPQNVAVVHTEPNEEFAGSKQRLIEFARNAGYRHELVQTIHDRNGRPVFEIFRFMRMGN